MALLYDKGDIVRVSGAFTNDAGVAQDPTTVIFRFVNPAGTSTTYTFGVDGALVKDSIGNYHVDIDANAEGDWHYRWESTGTGQAADEGQFRVDDSRFA
ncbi:MAG: hypothetical protein L0312_12765 [Acidobacteria bacterium]|nr:hypothetical protein [Acidobacteriota bacterium]